MVEKRFPNSGRVEYPVHDESFPQKISDLWLELEEEMLLCTNNLSEEERSKLPLLRESVARKIILLDLSSIINELRARFSDYISETPLEIIFLLGILSTVLG